MSDKSMKKKKTQSKINDDPHAQREAERYDHPVASREHIVTFLVEAGGFHAFGDLAKTFGIKGASQVEGLSRRLKAMVRDHQLIQNASGHYLALQPSQPLIGEVQAGNNRHYQVYVSDYDLAMVLGHHHAKGVFPGDEVEVKCAGLGPKGEFYATIEKVLQHNTTQLLGRIHTERHVSFVLPENRHIGQVILVMPGDQGAAKDGDFVLVDITIQPTAKTQAVGVVREVIGQQTDLQTAIDVAVMTFDLPKSWPASFAKLRFNKTVSDQDIKGRQDLTALPFVTIDGADAKDFDDAIYCQNSSNGGWQLYVAIADVSHYVPFGSELDLEAQQRGNSVYFPNRVIPMLPEALSNELCSLKPQVKRLCMCCEMTISATGQVKKSQFYKAVIYSHQRLTYDEVATYVGGDSKPIQDPKVRQSIEAVNLLFEILLNNRLGRGAIEIEVPELQFIINEKGRVGEICRKDRLISHRIIEECMLLANVAAAELLLKHQQPAVYRVHGDPKEDKIEALFNFASLMGYHRVGRDRSASGSALNHLLQFFVDKPVWMVMQILVLRSMKQAVYSPHNIGHFGLAFEAYTHFTSPIRRYADLLVHRSIKSVLDSQDSAAHVWPKEQLNQIADQITLTEKKADEASRDVSDGLKCAYLQDFVGKEFDVVVTSCHHFGLFVEIPELMVDGLVHVSTLVDDFYHFDEQQMCLRGELTAKVYSLGDRERAELTRADPIERKVDFVFLDQGPAIKSKSRRGSKKKVGAKHGGQTDLSLKDQTKSKKTKKTTKKTTKKSKVASRGKKEVSPSSTKAKVKSRAKVRKNKGQRKFKK